MKKLVLALAITIGTFSTYANAVIKQTNVVTRVTQDDYKETDTVPASIKNTLDEAYPGVKLDRAYINDKKEYKIEVTVRGEKSVVFVDAAGAIVKK